MPKSDAQLSAGATAFSANDAQQNILRETGCSEKAAPYVIRGFIFQGGVTSRYNGIPFNKTEPFGGRFGADRAHPVAIARYFLDEANCSGARGLSEEDRSSSRESRTALCRDRTAQPLRARISKCLILARSLRGSYRPGWSGSWG